MKKIVVFICFFVLTAFAFNTVSFALPDSKKSIDYTQTVISFLNEQPKSVIDASSLKISSIKELNNVKTGDFYAYLIDVEDNNRNYAYFVINANTGNVIEFAEAASPVTTSKYVSEAQSYYYSPLEYWAVNSNGTCINAVDGTIATLDGTSSSLYEERTAVNYINGTETMTLTSSPMVTMLYPDYGYISNVPAYVQASGYVCINTSILNVIAYWDNNGLPDLITGTILQARADIEACLVAAGGSGANASIPGAINSYATAHGNYYSDVWNIWYPEFFDLQFEINYGDPCLVGFPTYYGGGHMTTGVGYNIVSGVNYVIVHDNHVSYDVTIAFSEVDFIASISILDLY